MIVHTPEIRIEDGEISVRARIEFQTSISSMPDELWFKFPKSHKDWVTDCADGFVAAILLLAMAYGEDIEVRGVLSPRLLLGIQEYQRVFNLWFPKRFKLVDIHCDKFISLNRQEVKGAVACAFSGGVDSFYTLWSHLPQNEHNPHSQVSYALFVHGFDMPLEDEATFHTAREAYEEMLKKSGIRLLTARTNIQHFGTRPDWGIFHGSALIGSALVLGRLLTRFYVPASHTYNDLIPWGSDPRVDHLLSTETLEIVHDGASITRVEKTAVIARWPETFTQLRVCWAKNGLNNCSRCEKCIRTMITLDMFGMLSNYTTFPLPLERRMVRRCRYRTVSDFAFPREIINYAIKIGRRDIVLNLGYALLYSRLLFWKHQIKRTLLATCRRLLR
jgi:hypothetical protein